METNKKLRSVSLFFAEVLLLIIFISSTASASIDETQITKIKGDQFIYKCSIYGNNIVYADARNGNFDIFLYDLSTKKEKQLTTSKIDQVRPSIYGNNVLWAEGYSNVDYGYRLFLEDLTTKKVTEIPVGGTWGGCIYKNWIVYYGGDGGYDGLCVYDLNSKKEIFTSNYGFDATVYDNTMVYQDEPEAANLWAVNLLTGDETQITTSGSAQFPSIYGNKVVYSDYRNGNPNGPNNNFDIYMYDLSTKRETQITTDISNSMFPVIYGNNIVWQDNRNGNSNIYAYDLVTHQQIHTVDNSEQTAPVIYGNKIAWADYRNGIQYIYSGTISYLPVAAFTASPTSGKHPLNVKFTDKSTDVYYWSWNFGDKSTSTLPSPAHKYSKAGKYTVSLTVKNAAGSNTKKVSNYITVK